MEYVTLNNGIKMPVIGFGVFQIPDRKEAQMACENAIEAGYELIDTAAAYLNEEAVGDAVVASGKRDKLFITTKVWVQDHGYDNTLKAFDKSMKKLKLDVLDLYLIHKPYGDYYGTWRAMERLYSEGRIRAIGVTSFWNERLMDLILNHQVVPAVNQVETNLFFQQDDAHSFMKSEGVIHEAWSPFAEGNNDIFNHETVRKIAEKYHKTTAQVLLRHLLQKDVVVIPKSSKKQRIIENINVFDFTLSEEDMHLLNALDTGRSTIYDEMDPKIAKFICNVKYDL